MTDSWTVRRMQVQNQHSVLRVEDISEVLWGSGVSASTISELYKKAYVLIEERRNRRLTGE